MKLFAKLSTSLTLALMVSGSAVAEEYVKGEVVKVDTKQKKLTIKHEPLTNLDMPGMTMVFVVADDDMLDKVRAGESIEFTADRVNGRITVTAIK
jgi:Cu/Ag efflux protein CusF